MLMCVINWVAVGSFATASMAIITVVNMCVTRKQFNKQLEELKNQIDDNVFSQLINLFKDNRNALSIINNNGELVYGRSSIKIAIRRFENPRSFKQSGEPTYSENYYEVNMDVDNISSYYDSLLCLLDYALKCKNKDYYKNVIKNTLTDEEKKWLKWFVQYGTVKSYNDYESLRKQLILMGLNR